MKKFDALKFFIDAKALVYDIRHNRDDYTCSDLYRSPDGPSCLIGEMIDPDTYNPEMECCSVKELRRAMVNGETLNTSQEALLKCLTNSFGTMTEEDLRLIDWVQDINDTSPLPDWIRRVKEIERDLFEKLTEEDYAKYGLAFPKN